MPFRFPISFERLHPPDLCFFCKRRPISQVKEIKLYKTIQNTEGFGGYVARYATATIEIPICTACAESHRRSKMLASVLWWSSYAIAAIAISWSIHSEGNGWPISIAGGAFLGFLGGSIIGLLILVVWFPASILWNLVAYIFGRRTEEHASEKNFPLYKALAERCWQARTPRPKWDRRLHEVASPELLAKFHREAIEEALAITDEYKNAVMEHFKK